MLAPAYRPRRPTESVLYALVREHLETFLAHARASYGAPLPRYVEAEFREYLRCGVFAHGFVRAHCESCGYDLLVAFSCKLRGLCPSCAGRRMANTAAHLVDRVLPVVPVRQWVLSLPFELRALAAFDAKVLSALVRMFVGAVEARYRAWAKRAGVAGAARAQTGAVTFVQRFGSSLNLNVHFHVVFLDGVYTRDAVEGLVFHPAPPPSPEELEVAVQTVYRRALAWLGRYGHLDRAPLEERNTDEALSSPIEACATIATQRGTMRTLAQDAGPTDLPTEAIDRDAPAREADAVEYRQFNLHASVRIAPEDDRGRERLCRYGARPPFSLDRLRVLRGGLVAYRIRQLGGGRAKHRVMTPLELLARLAALVPPPRYPLVRYHGVLAPRSAWRREVVPRPPTDSMVTSAKATKAACSPSRAEERASDDRESAGTVRGRRPAPHGGRADGARSPTPASAGAGPVGGGCRRSVLSA